MTPTLARYRRALTAQLGAITCRLAVRPTVDEIRGDEGEQSARTVEQDVSIAEHERLREQAQQIRSTLDRIEDGSFGSCLTCGDAIPAKRLEALPWAARCARCAASAEREREYRSAARGRDPEDEA